MNGQDVQDRRELVDELQDHQSGDRVSLTVYRNGRQRVLQARLTSEQEISRSQFQDGNRGGYSSNDRNQDQNGESNQDQSNRNNENDGSSQR